MNEKEKKISKIKKLARIICFIISTICGLLAFFLPLPYNVGKMVIFNDGENVVGVILFELLMITWTIVSFVSAKLLKEWTFEDLNNVVIKLGYGNKLAPKIGSAFISESLKLKEMSIEEQKAKSEELASGFKEKIKKELEIENTKEELEIERIKRENEELKKKNEELAQKSALVDKALSNEDK